MTENKFKSILTHIGDFLKKALSIGTEAAVDVEPIIDLAFPGISQLYNFTVQQVSMAEAAAAGTVGTGAQKLSAVTAAVLPYATAAAKNAGFAAPKIEHITDYVNAVVSSLKVLPAVLTSSETTKPAQTTVPEQGPAPVQTAN